MDPNTRALVQGVTIRGGESNVDGGVVNYGTRSLLASTVRDNAAEFGGGVYSAFGALDVIDSAIVHNTAERSGAGLYLSNNVGPVAVNNTRRSDHDKDGDKDFGTKRPIVLPLCSLRPFAAIDLPS